MRGWDSGDSTKLISRREIWTAYLASHVDSQQWLFDFLPILQLTQIGEIALLIRGRSGLVVRHIRIG